MARIWLGTSGGDEVSRRKSGRHRRAPQPRNRDLRVVLFALFSVVVALALVGAVLSLAGIGVLPH